MSIAGGCHCRKFRFTLALEALADVATCHCRACRQTTGGTHVTWATIPRQALRWESLEPQAYASSDHATRYFCPSCGAQLAFHTVRAPEVIDITISSLDDPDRFPPTRHIWTKSKLAWTVLNDGLPQEEREVAR